MISAYLRNNKAFGYMRPFLVTAALLGLATLWLLGHNYINDIALLRWSLVLTVFDTPEVRLENIGLMHPHVPVYALIPFYYSKILATPAAPYLVSVLSGALLLTIWNYQLKINRYSDGMRYLMVAVVMTNPLFLWVVTTGSGRALSLLCFFLICFAIMRTLLQRDTRGVILLAGSLGAYFFVDEKAFFVVIAAVPLLPLIASPKMLRESPLGVYVLILLPAVFSILSWFYLNWIFHGDAETFLTAPDSEFLAARLTSGESLWLLRYGGTLATASIIVVLSALAMFPALGWQLYAVWHTGRLRHGIGVYFLIPVVAAAIATAGFYLGHPAEMLFLLLAGVMLGMLVMPRNKLQQRQVAVALLLLGNLLTILLFYYQPSGDMRNWQQAMSGRQLEQQYAEELRLGRWLAVGDRATLIDERAGYRVIASRGGSGDLLLSHMPEFKFALKHDVPSVEQLVVMNPKHKEAYLDRVTQRYPRLFNDGMPGYARVYSGKQWAVFRRID